MKSSTSTVPYSHTRPRSLRPRSTSITCSARSFSSSSSSPRDARVLLGVSPARPRAGDRARRDAPTRHGQQRLRARAGDLEVPEVEEVHVRARVDRAQAAVDRERARPARTRTSAARERPGRRRRRGRTRRCGRPSPRRPRAACCSRTRALRVRVRRMARRAAPARRAASGRRRSRRGRRRRRRRRSSSAYTLASTLTVCLRWSNTTSTSVSISARSGTPTGSGLGSPSGSTVRTRS